MNIVIPILRYKNNASVNRLLAYAKGFGKQGINVKILFLISRDKHLCKINYKNVTILDLWKSDNKICQKYIFLSYIKNFLKIKKYIKKNDCIFWYEINLINLLYSQLFLLKIKTICEITEHPLRRKNTIYKRFYVRCCIWLLKKIDGLFVISNALKEYFVDNGIDEHNIHIVNMFVDASRFCNLVKTTKEHYIGYCGTVSAHKDGVDILIKAFDLIHTKYPQYKLYIMGKGGIDPLSYFVNLVHQLHLEDCVIFTGEIDRDKMPQMLYNAEILALSRPDNLQNQNGFPTKLGEYLATGNPIVLTAVGDIPMYIKDKVNGIFAKPSDVNDFAEQLEWTIEHKKEAFEIGKAGQMLVHEEFSYLTQSKKILDVLLNV